MKVNNIQYDDMLGLSLSNFLALLFMEHNGRIKITFTDKEVGDILKYDPMTDIFTYLVLAMTFGLLTHYNYTLNGSICIYNRKSNTLIVTDTARAQNVSQLPAWIYHSSPLKKQVTIKPPSKRLVAQN